MKRKYISYIGAMISIALLLIASQPAVAVTNGGTLGVHADFLGGAPPLDYTQYYNATVFDPETDTVCEWWDDDDVTFTLWLNSTNSRPGPAVDFIWKIWCSVETAESYTIVGGDNSPRTDNPEYVTINGMGPDTYDNRTITINIDGPTMNIDIYWELTVKENGIIKAQTLWYWLFLYLVE